MDSLLQDCRFAIRLSLRTPGFTAIAVLALALGIGANTAIFTIVNAALLERLPYKDPDRLVALWEVASRPTTKINVISPANFSRWAERNRSFDRVVGRLKGGATWPEAQAGMTAVGGPVAMEFPEGDTGWGARVLPLHDAVSGEYRSALLVLAGAVAFVLLIACANVANLLLARGA